MKRGFIPFPFIKLLNKNYFLLSFIPYYSSHSDKIYDEFWLILALYIIRNLGENAINFNVSLGTKDNHAGENGQMPLSKKKNPTFCPISQTN